jgi:hypothetical protein
MNKSRISFDYHELIHFDFDYALIDTNLDLNLFLHEFFYVYRNHGFGVYDYNLHQKSHRWKAKTNR